MSKVLFPTKKQRFILQHIYTLEYVTKQATGFLQKAEYTFTTNRLDATSFTNDEANAIIAATATDNGKDTEKEFMIMETLRAIEI